MTKLPYTTEQIETAAAKIHELEIQLADAQSELRSMEIANINAKRAAETKKAQVYSPAKHEILSTLSGEGTRLTESYNGIKLIFPRDGHTNGYKSITRKTFDNLFTAGFITRQYTKERGSHFVITQTGRDTLQQWNTNQANKAARKSLEWKSE